MYTALDSAAAFYSVRIVRQVYGDAENAEVENAGGNRRGGKCESGK